MSSWWPCSFFFHMFALHSKKLLLWQILCFEEGTRIFFLIFSSPQLNNGFSKNVVLMSLSHALNQKPENI